MIMMSPTLSIELRRLWKTSDWLDSGIALPRRIWILYCCGLLWQMSLDADVPPQAIQVYRVFSQAGHGQVG